MDKSLLTLTDALKKIINQLNPQINPISLILLLGKSAQGKTTLLRQSSLKNIALATERPIDLFYNAHGIILELNETWFTARHSILQQTIKALNRCHRAVRVTGLLLSVDINTLYESEIDIVQKMKEHVRLLHSCGHALGQRMNTSLMFTKVDGLAGFSDFFQNDHISDLAKPLGFSLDWRLHNEKLT